jgi:hypothetical protein
MASDRRLARDKFTQKRSMYRGEYLAPIRLEKTSYLAEQNFVVRYPDGRILALGECGIESEAKLIEYFQEKEDFEEQLRVQRANRKADMNRSRESARTQ